MQLLAEVIEAWSAAGFDPPELEDDIPNVSALTKPDWEMILSVHFYYDKNSNDDDLEDTQYCKVVYTYSSLENNLAKIRSVSSSSTASYS